VHLIGNKKQNPL